MQERLWVEMLSIVIFFFFFFEKVAFKERSGVAKSVVLGTYKGRIFQGREKS